MHIRAKASLRLGLAGGGTDVSPYCNLYSGAILNANISMYAYATIVPKDDRKIVINSIDRGVYLEFESAHELPKVLSWVGFFLTSALRCRLRRFFLRLTLKDPW